MFIQINKTVVSMFILASFYLVLPDVVFAGGPSKGYIVIESLAKSIAREKERKQEEDELRAQHRRNIIDLLKTGYGPEEFTIPQLFGEENVPLSDISDILKSGYEPESEEFTIEQIVKGEVKLKKRVPSIKTETTRKQSLIVSVPSKTVIEETMDFTIFNLCGLNKLTKEEIQNLDEWLMNVLNIAYQKGKSETKVLIPTQPRLKIVGDLEEAIIVKDFDGDKIIIERANGEKWILEAKTWCNWSWKFEGKKVILKFGYTSSKLINEDGDICEFWTEEEID